MTRHWLELVNQWLEETRPILWLDSDSIRPSHESTLTRQNFRWLWLDKNDSGTSLVPTVHRLLLTKCRESSLFTLCCIALQKTDWLMIVTEINKVDCNVKTRSHFLSCRSCSNSIKVTWRLQLRCDAVFMASSPSSSPRFSLLAVIFRTTLNKITSRRFQLHLQKAPLCSGITFHLFLLTYSPAFAIP